MIGIKHLIKCRCILPQFKESDEPVFHQFIVFSILDEEKDKLILKITQCNNCDAIHTVDDICKSTIVNGKESSMAIVTIDDIRQSIPENIANILDMHDSPLYAWEEIKFIFKNKKWNSKVILVSETLNDTKHGKLLNIHSANDVEIENFSTEVYANNDRLT